jgi:hypothetical protein
MNATGLIATPAIEAATSADTMRDLIVAEVEHRIDMARDQRTERRSPADGHRAAGAEAALSALLDYITTIRTA